MVLQPPSPPTRAVGAAPTQAARNVSPGTRVGARRTTWGFGVPVPHLKPIRPPEEFFLTCPASREGGGSL